MTRTLPLPTRTEAPHVTDLDARLRLDAAVRELTEPTVEKLDRVDRVLDSLAAAQTREDREIDRGLTATHARLLRAGHALHSPPAAQTRRARETARGLPATPARLLRAAHAAQAATVMSRLLA